MASCASTVGLVDAWENNYESSNVKYRRPHHGRQYSTDHLEDESDLLLKVISSKPRYEAQ
jgi:hypothetical protein